MPQGSAEDEETNSSLVFGNDRSEETQRDITYGEENDPPKDNDTSSPQKTMSTPTFTPSMAHGDTQLIHKYEQSSPLTFRNHSSNYIREQDKTERQGSVENDLSAVVEQKKEEQEPQEYKDTQIITPSNTLQNSQNYKHTPDETQLIPNIEGGHFTQQFSSQHVPQNWDTQVIPRIEGTQVQHETQVLQTLPETHDTQVIHPILPPHYISDPPTLPSATLTDTLKAGLEDFQNTMATSSPRVDEIQQSRTQVINTQEVTEEHTTPTVSSTKPVISSSQRSQQEREEIQSEEDDWTYLHMDDTLELGRNKRNEQSSESRKRLKNGNSHETIPSSPTVTTRMTTRKRIVEDTQSVDEKSGVGSTQRDTTALREEVLNTISESQIVSRNSVWAAHEFRMYTGVVLETGAHELSVDFEDDTYTIKNADLHLLDVRIGDKLRIRTSPHEYFVSGLVRKPDFDGICCIRGYTHVFLKKFSKKDTKEVLVELEQCSMELPEWINHQQKFGIVTASEIAQTTPRRRTKEDLSVISNQLVKPTSDIFKGCLFCLTNIGKGISEQRRSQLRNLVETNGGVLLEDGFETLFGYKSDENGHRIISDQLDDFYFAAVVSNSYGRSAKFLQALSLGWPIVSDTFIFDCANGSVLINEWPIYLLPAGQSKKTNAVKSMDVYRFRNKFEQGCKLNSQLENNGHLLTGYHVLFLDNKANNKNWDTCEFIFHAFGARSLRHVRSKAEVKKHMDPTQRQYLVYDNSGAFKADSDAEYNLIDWEWVVQCAISGYTWEPKSFK